MTTLILEEMQQLARHADDTAAAAGAFFMFRAPL
jgi:hypothetical protein